MKPMEILLVILAVLIGWLVFKSLLAVILFAVAVVVVLWAINTSRRL